MLAVTTQAQGYNGPQPTPNQLRWQDMEMYAFIHYSLNTYTDQEWGFGNEPIVLLISSVNAIKLLTPCKDSCG